jgi:1-acyl-sn-glycerol-3-phosphate acyltransferase
MFGRFFASITNRLMKNKLLFWVLFLIISAILVVGIGRLRIDKDIYSIFPDGKEFQDFSKVIQENNLNKQLVFSFKASEDEDVNFDRLNAISSEIEQQFSKEVGNLQVYRMVDQAAMVEYLQSASIAYLTTEDYQQLPQKLTVDAIEKQLQDVKHRLSGANSLFIGGYFAKDPLNILGKKMAQFNVQSDSSAYTVENGVVYSFDKSKVFFFADLLIDSKNNEQLKVFDEQLKSFAKKQDASIDFDVFGVYQISLANADQIQKDTMLTSILSVSLILLVLVVYYRSVVVPFFFLLPAGFGVLAGLGMTGFLNPEINAISIATSSVLLGIVLDYAFHFYTHYKHSGDLLETVREIGTPMIVGSFTTVAAFAALLLTESIVLKNFGLIALFTLLGSALFTLLALPVIIDAFGLKLKSTSGEVKEKKSSKLVFRLLILGVVAFTTFCLLKSQGLNFDGDLNNLSYHPAELKNKEKSFTGIHPQSEKRLYVFSNGSTIEEAKTVSEKLYGLLQTDKEKFKVTEIISPSPYMISSQRLTTQNDEWISFWKKYPDVKQDIMKSGTTLGFSENAFQPFFESIEHPKNIVEEGKTLIEQMGMTRLIHSDGENNSLLTSIIVSKSTVEELKQEIRSIDGVYIMDISEIASGMLVSVKNDFNFLLYFSSSIVFLSLLVVYGRIELALFAFFPMMLSWIWIIGITSVFNIQFNLVNIIITTFIFGLGDDFSIFITDGLIQKYKTRKDSISSYRSAIILSGITTIIGTGALIFAKHPSINSIAMVSVIGLATILLITLYVQPGIFHWFVTRRTTKKRGPITFFIFVYSFLLFIYFFVGSIFLTVLLLFFVVPFPVKKVKKQQFMNYVISKLAKSTMYAGVHVRKKVVNPEKLDYSTPSIIVANHTSFLDILTVLMLNPKTIIMVKSWVYNSPVFGPFIRYAGYIFVENGTETNLEIVRKQFENGYSLVIFPEGTRSKDGEIHRFHKGAFLLSKQLNVPIQPLLLVGLHEINPKNDIMINPGELYVQPLDRVYPSETESDKEYTKRVQQLMRSGFAEAKNKYAKTKYWKASIVQNYVLKGPVLEWYVRVKYGLERKNFEYYDELIGNRKTIYDIGCGYGYLSYYLHYRNQSRRITGLDYDEEKALTADCALKRNENLQFEYADVKSYDFKPCDAIFLNDVLHYLPKTDQTNLLNQLVEVLQPDGILFIRDGVTDLDHRLKNTERTEQLSTKWFKFNKAENELEFLKISEIKAFAAVNNMTFELVEHSKTTSNVLFILRKGN